MYIGQTCASYGARHQWSSHQVIFQAVLLDTCDRRHADTLHHNSKVSILGEVVDSGANRTEHSCDVDRATSETEIDDFSALLCLSPM